MKNFLPNFLLDGLFKLDYDSFIELIYLNQKYIDFNNEHGETLLHFASYYGLVDKFIILVNMGAKQKKTINNDTLLHYCSLGGKDYYLFHNLIKEGYNLLETNNQGLTPLHLCKDLSMSSMSYRYLEMKDLKFKLSKILDFNGNNPAHIAAQNNHQEVLNFFIQEEPSIVSTVNFKGQTPLNIEYSPYLVCRK